MEQPVQFRDPRLTAFKALHRDDEIGGAGLAFLPGRSQQGLCLCVEVVQLGDLGILTLDPLPGRPEFVLRGLVQVVQLGDLRVLALDPLKKPGRLVFPGLQEALLLVIVLFRCTEAG